MNKLLILIFCFSSLFLVGQDIVVEVEAGISNFASKDRESIFVPSFGLGANYEKSISEKFTASLGAKINRKGSATERSFGRHAVNLYYIEIPLLFRANLPLAKVSIHPEFGIYWSRALLVTSSREGMKIEGKKLNETGFSKADIGMYFGFGVTTNNLMIMLRFSNGLKDINTFEDVVWKNKIVSLSFRRSLKNFKKINHKL